MSIVWYIIIAWPIVGLVVAILFGKAAANGHVTPVPEPAPLRIPAAKGAHHTGSGEVHTTRLAGCAVLEVIEHDGSPTVALLPAVIGDSSGCSRCGVDVDVTMLSISGVGAERVTDLLCDAERFGERVDVIYEVTYGADGTADLQAITVTICGDRARRASAIETSPSSTRL